MRYRLLLFVASAKLTVRRERP